MNNLQRKKASDRIISIALALLSLLFIAPILIVLMNSFKSKLFISSEPFRFPNTETFTGRANYIEGAKKINFFKAFWLLALHYDLQRPRCCLYHEHARVVPHPGKVSFYPNHLLPPRLLNDRSLPNGDVHDE